MTYRSSLSMDFAKRLTVCVCGAPCGYAPAYSAGVLVGGIGYHLSALPGRDNAILPEPTSSHTNCLTAHKRAQQSHHHGSGVRPEIGCITLALGLCHDSPRGVLPSGRVIAKLFRDAVLGSFLEC